MFSRTGALLFCLGFTAGVIAFGCASTARREPAGTARAQAQPSPAPPPTPVAPVLPASWTPSDAQPPREAPRCDQPASPAFSAANLPVQPASTGNAPPQLPAAPVAMTPPGSEAPATVNSLSPDGSAAKVRELYRQAVDSYARIDSYIARLRRREEVGGRSKPEELLLFKFRKQPWSVYFKWLGPQSKGREAIFVKGQHDSKLHTLLAAGDIPFMPAGKQIALDPESSLVRSRSRHAVTEAGIGHVIEEMGRRLQAKDLTSLRYLGLVRRPEYVAPLEGIEQTIPPGGEAGPDGGTRQLFFDPANHLPVLLILRNAKGHELEYYCYDLLQYPVHLDDDDFNPEKLWKTAGDASGTRR